MIEFAVNTSRSSTGCIETFIFLDRTCLTVSEMSNWDESETHIYGQISQEGCEQLCVSAHNDTCRYKLYDILN